MDKHTNGNIGKLTNKNSKVYTEVSLRLVPLVDFSKKRTDEDLFEMLNITENEQKVIKGNLWRDSRSK
jgi:hypothetical protein